MIRNLLYWETINTVTRKVKVKEMLSLNRAIWFQKIEALSFEANQHMKEVILLSLHNGRAVSKNMSLNSV